MPVIQLPRDDRFGQIGQGLGNLIGGAITAFNDKNVQQGVAEIMQDPSISDSEKGVQALKKFGDKGYTFYQQFVKTRVLDAQLKDTLADVALKGIKAKAEEAKLPTVAKQAEANVALTGSQTAENLANVSQIQTMLPARLEALGAQTTATQATTATENALRQPRVAGAVAGALEKSEDVDANRMKNAATGQVLLQEGIPVPPTVGRGLEVAQEQPALAQPPAGTGTVGRLGDLVKPFNLTPDEQGQVQSVYTANERKKRGTGLDAALDHAKSLATAKAKAEKPAPLPEGSAKLARGAAGYGAVSERFMQDVIQDPEKVGLLSGAGLKARLDRYGLPVGDQTLLNMLEAQKQLVAQQAKSGAVFMSAQTIKLAKDIAPSVDRSPLSNLLSLGSVARERLAELSNELLRYKDTPVQVAAINDAMRPWQNIQKVTDTIQSHVVTDERGRNERTVMYFMGNQVNPLSMKPLVKNDDSTKYPIRDKGDGRKSVTGAELFRMSPMLGNKDPAQILRELQ